MILTLGGWAWPDRSGLYGAPFPVGDSAGFDVVFGGGASFFFPLWVLNYFVTVAVVWVLVTAFDGTPGAGLVAASLALVAAYATVVVLPGTERHSNQLVIWVWTLLVVAAIWAINRYRRRPVEQDAIRQP